MSTFNLVADADQRRLFASIVCLVFCAAQDSFPSRPVFVTLRRGLLLFSLPIEVVISAIYVSAAPYCRACL